MGRNYSIALAALLFIVDAQAAELGYGLVDQWARVGCCESARGIDLRLHFGGDHATSDRYDGDRFALSLSYVNPKRAHNGAAYGWTDYHGHPFQANALPSQTQLSIVHRWYTAPGAMTFLPKLRLYVGSGLAWRRVETCGTELLDGWGSAKDRRVQTCFKGTALVSSNWCFAQSFGAKWREHLELAYDHCSTGGFSGRNRGENLWRFSLLGEFGKKDKRSLRKQ